MNAIDIRGLILVDSLPSGRDGLLARTPFAMVDVAGMSPLERIAQTMRRHGVSPMAIVVEDDSAYRRRRPIPPGMAFRAASPDRYWRLAEGTFNDLAQNGTELVLVVRLGPYAEIDFEKLVQFHLAGPRRVTQVVCGGRPLEIFCLSASRRNDAASLFRSQLGQCRSQLESYEHDGYFNPLAGPGDLRQFAIDVLTLNTETQPAGTEVRPGVWVGSEASIEKGSRILAPAFIGASARIGCGSLITRCSTIERHAHVDCGTVVENSTVLPYSYVGAGLDIAHSVVRIGHIASLRRGVTVKVSDQKLLGRVSSTGARYLWKAAVSLPARIWNGIFRNGSAPPPPLEDALLRPSSALGVSACDTKVAGEFASDLMAVRRYGDQ